MASTNFSYADFVVVAEDQWNLHSEFQTSCSEFTGQLGNFEWNIYFQRSTEIIVECRELYEKTYTGEVHLEIFIYARNGENRNYELWKTLAHWNPPSAAGNDQPVEANPQRILLKCPHSATSTSNSAQFNNQHIYDYAVYDREHDKEFISVTIRILKDRKEFWDFTLDKPFGHWTNNTKLKVGETIFHVNKEFLILMSPYFDRLFNNEDFVEANNEVIDTGETDSALYQDFLLTITPGKYTVLANPKNVAGLLRLAKYYQIESVMEKLERTLKLAREIPMLDRIVLARKYGSKELHASLMRAVESTEEAKQIYLALMDEYQQ